jgi:hypothetical protein
MVVPSSKLVDVSLNFDVLVEDELASAELELLDELVAALDELDEVELNDDELGVLLDDELGTSEGAVTLLLPDDPPPQAASSKNDK